MEKNLYITNLVEQFVASTGTKNIDINSPEFIKDFSEWIRQNKVVGIQFSCALEDMGIYLDTTNCAEIGKGQFDSIVLADETTIISPFIQENSRITEYAKTINGNFIIYNGNPTIIKDGKEIIVNPSEINKFMTHNPYNGTNIHSWIGLHNNTKYDGIVLGLYGRTTDKDRETKEKQFYNLRSALHSDYIDEEITYGDKYFYILATDTHKRKIRTLK